MAHLLAGFGGFFLLSFVVLRGLGYHTALPLSFIPALALICVPISLVVVCGAVIVPARHGWPSPNLATRVLCVAMGLVLTYWLSEPAVWIVLAVVLAVATHQSWTPRVLRNAAVGLCVMTVGYACVWNGNYLAAVAVENRLLDSSLLSIDIALLRWLRLAQPGSDVLFPWTAQPHALRLLEHSYLMLFPQVIIGLLFTALYGSATVLARWLAVLFGAYAAGLLVFVMVPAVGPPIYAPWVFEPGFAETTSGQLMKLMADEFRQFHAGGALSGFGYFVALPSLHVAVAVLTQSTMRGAPYLFWTWLPVTTLLILSTVILGYHYLLDVPAGLALGLACAHLAPRPPPTPPSLPPQRRPKH